MEDSKIVELYWDRNPDAIPETSQKYGNYCTAIARNILGNKEDAEECVNDTYLNAWNSIPPNRPFPLSIFLGKITRNLSFNRYKYNRAQKRGGGEMTLVLDELGECVSGEDAVWQEINKMELLKAINAFLSRLSDKKRNLFISRYWYAESTSEIAKRYQMTESNINMALSRLRKQLGEYLAERGFVL